MPTSRTRSCRWLQWSLRTLLLAMLVVAVFFGGRESGRRLLEAEKKRADAELARSEASTRRAQLAIAEARLWHASREVARQERVLRKLEQAVQRSHQELERLRRTPFTLEFLPSNGLNGSPPSVDVDRLERHSVPINEYWQRQESPTRFPDSPRLRTPLPTIS